MATGNRRRISFLHPGYASPHNILFRLPRVEGHGGALGVNHQTALLACQIIANNAFDRGRLFYDREGQLPVPSTTSSGHDNVLTDEKYYFHVGSQPDILYPIVPCFRDWQFPHDTMPPTWLLPISPPEPIASSLSGSSQRRCAVTNHCSAVTTAPIVPREELEWFRRNDMCRYAADPLGELDSPENLFPLRADVHFCLDAGYFALVLEAVDADGSRKQAFATHVLTTDPEFISLYQNIRAYYLEGASPEYLLARFAWALFMLVKPFVTAGTSRRVVQCVDRGVRYEWKVALLDGPALVETYGGGRRRERSESPGKKSRKPQSGAAGDGAAGDGAAGDDRAGPWLKRLLGEVARQRLEPPSGSDAVRVYDGTPMEVNKWYRLAGPPADGEQGRSRKRPCVGLSNASQPSAGSDGGSGSGSRGLQGGVSTAAPAPSAAAAPSHPPLSS